MLVSQKDRNRLLKLRYPRLFRDQATFWSFELEVILKSSPLFPKEVNVQEILFREFIKNPKTDENGFLLNASQVCLPYSILVPADFSGKVEVIFLLDLPFEDWKQKAQETFPKKFLSLEAKSLHSLQKHIFSNMKLINWKGKVAFSCRLNSSGRFFHDQTVLNKNHLREDYKRRHKNQ